MSHKFTPLSFLFGFVCLSMTVSFSLYAQTGNPTQQVELKNRTIEFSNSLQTLNQYLANLPKETTIQLILKFDQDDGGQGAKAATSVQKEDYVGPNSYVCLVRTTSSPTNWQKLGVVAWAKLEPRDKISAAIIHSGVDSTQQMDLLVQLSSHYDKNKLEELLGKLNASRSVHQVWMNQNMLQIQLLKSNIIILAQSSEVLYIQPKFEAKALNVMAEGYTNTEIAHQPVTLGGYGLLGDGITAGIGDNSNPHHVDYNDRLTSFSPEIDLSHGIHTTGTVGGAGIKDQRYRGFAPHADLIADFFTQIIANAPTYFDDFGMVATNNSYAMLVGDCNYAGKYDEYSVYLDQQAFDLPKVLNIFAAGNDGAFHCSPYPQGYGTVEGAYQAAKNVLTVGAIGKTRDIEYYKFSRGPVADGRLKPEITGMGYRLISTGPDNSYVLNSGTSMSTPNLTGGAVLLNQRFRQLNNNQKPSNALIKLLLMNGADDIAEPGPDFHYGFGLMNIGRSLTMLDSSQYFSGISQTGIQQSFPIQIPANTSVAKIMLYWNDPAASPMAAKDLVNDLDLTVASASTTFKPLVLNSSPSQVTVPASPGEDHLNNVEQVTINQPSAGNYTIHVKGYNIPQGPQTYYVAYSFISEGMAFQYPFGGEALDAGDSIYIYWQASEDSNPFTLAFSDDNGSHWQNLVGNIPSDKRAFLWHIPLNMHSTKCLLKITRGNETAVNKAFTILGRPVTTVAPTATQCRGSVNFSWHTINGVTSYRIFKKSGIDMVAIDSTSDTTYTLRGLSPDSLYWVAVAPVLNNKAGMRSVAFSYQPNQGNCALVSVHGDLRLSKINSPQNGRQFTQTALTTNSPFSVKVQNLDNQVANNFSLFWQLNSNSWQSQNFYQNINPSGSIDVQLSALNLSDTGDYQLKVAIVNNSLPDPVTSNDTIVVTIRQLSNNPLTLLNTYSEGFEDFPKVSVINRAVVGIGQSNHWDFIATGEHGRFRSYVNTGITIQDNRSVSLDNTINEFQQTANSSQNYFTGTFNLSQFSSLYNEVRGDFDYILSGVPKFDTGNQVWIRGSDNDPWLPLYKYEFDTLNPGFILNSGSLSLSDALKDGGQDFSTSTQIRFCQRDTSQISTLDYGNGLTMDNFNLYVVHNDIQLLGMDSVFHYNCALSDQVPLRVKIYNSVQNTVYHIPVTFQLDSLPAVTEIIDSIVGKDTLSFQFATHMDISSPGTHSVSVWCAVPADTYHLNDSILNFQIRNQPVISSFPYLQDFEQDAGSFYADGLHSSWQYGTPNSQEINHAASGNKVWKTNLTGSYNDLEQSYLYSPCFDISQLDKPMLSFSLATDLENNPDDSTIFDEAYVEYSTDGLNWQRLGTANEGYNWYNNSVAKAWTKRGETWWHVATTPLPKIQDGTISFRFVLKTDQGASFEGVALDDIHIYDLKHRIYSLDTTATLDPQNIPANANISFIKNNEIWASLVNSGNPLNNTTISRFQHDDFFNADRTQYFLPESFVIKSDNLPDSSIDLRLYVLGDAMKRVREDKECPSCAPVKEIYSMGISQYSDKDKDKENGLLLDNLKGEWDYIPHQKISYIPYDKGYEVRLKIKKFSEIWFNSGGPNGNATLDEHLFDFQASHYEEHQAKLTWFSKTDEQTTYYLIQRSDSSENFQTIARIPAIHENGHEYVLTDSPTLYKSYVLYRILYENQDNKIYQSPVRRLDWTEDEGSVWIYPNPIHNGTLFLRWMKGTEEPLKWQFFDYSGRLIRSGQTTGNPFNGREDLNFGQWGWAPGGYLLKIYGSTHQWHFKVIYQP